MGQLQVTVVNASNVPAMDRSGTSDPYVEVIVNNQTQKTSVQKDTLKPTWNETFTFNGISIHDSISIQLNDWNRFGKKNKIGKVENIILMGLLQEAKGTLGIDFNFTKKFFVSEKFTNCTVTISISFDFDAKQAQKREKKKSSIGIFDKVGKVKSSIMNNSSITINNNNNGVAIMGRPYPRNYKMIVYVYQARNLDALDDSGFSDPYFEITYCGKRGKTNIIKKTLNPQWMETIILNVNVPQPAKYAPRIRCSCYDWDRFSGNDLIGRFFIPFLDVIDMMNNKKPRWYHLYNHKTNNKMDGKVYIAIEFIDANQKNKPIFKIDKTANPFYLHLLTIGVRTLKSSLGVHKPQIVYTAPLAGSVEEIATDPSSNPSAKNANFLVIQKLPIKIPIDYELAPVINIIARDNLFGGLVKRSIGSSIIDLHQFMILLKSDNNEWKIKENRIEILNEKQLKLEITAEERAERREYKAESRMNLLSIKKSIELSEARCQNRPFNKKQLLQIEEIGKNYVEIESSESYRNRLYKEEDELKRQKDEEEKQLKIQIEQEKEAARRKKEINEMKIEEEEEEEVEEDSSDEDQDSSESEIKEEDKPKEKEKEKKLNKRGKKKIEKAKKKAAEAALKEWDAENED
eukprot:303497_1